MSTETTFIHHMQALGGGQLEEVLSDYTEESTIFTNNGVFKGLEAVRGFFEASIKNTPPDLMKAFTVIRQDIVGDVAYLLWKAEPFIPLATDTFVVRSGKIIAQTFTVFAA